MRPQGPTFFLIGGSSKQWLTASVRNVGVGEQTGLTLSGRPDSPFVLTSADGSLGRLVLPIGMATDEEGIIYLLGQRRPGVRRFDPETCAFVPLAGVGDEFGTEVGQFHEQFADPSNPSPSNIATTGHNLYVADRGNRRIQVFALGTLSVRHVWGPRDRAGRRTTATSRRAWEPVDVAARKGRAYILDRRYSRVYLHVAGTDDLRPFIKGPTSGNRWSRIAVDGEGRVYLLHSEGPQAQVEIYDQRGRYLETKTEAGDIRDRFERPAVELRRIDSDDPWKFSLPADLKSLCDVCGIERERLAFEQICDESHSPPATETLRPETSGELVFDREGERYFKVPQRHTGPQVFLERGEWRSQPLDSQTYHCQWHRIELELYRLPAGTRVEVYTYTDAERLAAAEAEARLDKLGMLAHSVAGQIEPPTVSMAKSGDARNQSCKNAVGVQDTRGQGSVGTCAGAGAENHHEFLVQSREGQHLYLKIVLLSDGYDTPAIRSLRVHYPRSAYLEYLPAVYSTDDESRWFLERFLSIFQTEWDSLERCIRDVAALFDPQSVPPGPALEYLASWFALPLEGTWKSEQKRRLLEGVAKIYFGSWKLTEGKTVCLTEVDPAGAVRRGTIQGLRRYLQIYLQNITGISPDEQGGFPQIDEGFRERQRLMLSLGTTSMLSRGAPLWSPAAIGRLHLGAYAREGEARLVSTGDPEHEIFQEFAHRFRVFIPSSWIRTAQDEDMVHRALREEKPAHTSYDLCLVEPRFRVGLQSTVGIDTILGAWPRARLACIHDTDIPPSRLPRQCLGLDTILAARSGDQPTMQIGPKTRAGMETLLN